MSVWARPPSTTMSCPVIQPARRLARNTTTLGAKLHRVGSIRVRPSRLVVPDPPVVRRGLGIALRRVLPLLLTPERGDVEVGPGAAHRLVAAVVDEVGTEHAVAVTDERICAMPLIDSEVLVEVVGDRVPRDQPPSHARLQARDVRLRRTRDEGESGVAGVQMSG